MAPSEPRRADQSMDLLLGLFRDAVDPSYAVAARSGVPKHSAHLLAAIGLLIFGLMIGMSFVQTRTDAAAALDERTQLINRVKAAEQQQDKLRAQLAAVQTDVRNLSNQVNGGSASQGQLDALDVSTGMRPVTGPGFVLVVDEGGDSQAQGSRIVDSDIVSAVNGLWAAGAEAIAINGHRLSSRTAIRGAGGAITVDYRSLTRPYRIEAIGDAAQLRDRFENSSGGALWSYLKQNFGMTINSFLADNLTLPADPGLGLDFAKPDK